MAAITMLFETKPLFISSEIITKYFYKDRFKRFRNGTRSGYSPIHIQFRCISIFMLNPCPGNSFCDVCRQVGDYFTTPGISTVLEHISTKFQRLSPYFRGQAFHWCHSLPLLRDVDIRQKSKMAVVKIKCTDFTAV